MMIFREKLTLRFNNQLTKVLWCKAWQSQIVEVENSLAILYATAEIFYITEFIFWAATFLNNRLILLLVDIDIKNPSLTISIISLNDFNVLF